MLQKQVQLELLQTLALRTQMLVLMLRQIQRQQLTLGLLQRLLHHQKQVLMLEHQRLLQELRCQTQVPS